MIAEATGKLDIGSSGPAGGGEGGWGRGRETWVCNKTSLYYPACGGPLVCARKELFTVWKRKGKPFRRGGQGRKRN